MTALIPPRPTPITLILAVVASIGNYSLFLGCSIAKITPNRNYILV